MQKSQEQPQEESESRGPPPVNGNGSGQWEEERRAKGNERQPNAGNPFQTLGSLLGGSPNGGKSSGQGGKGTDVGPFPPSAEQQNPYPQTNAGQESQNNLGNPFKSLESILDNIAKGGRPPNPALQQDKDDNEKDDANQTAGWQSPVPSGEGFGAAGQSGQGARQPLSSLQGAASGKGGAGGKGSMNPAAGKGRRPNQPGIPKFPQTSYPGTVCNPWFENYGGLYGLSSGRQSAVTVSIKGTNIKCRSYPDSFIADKNTVAHFSSPSRVDVTCWTPSSPGTVGFQAMQNPIVAAAHLPSAIAGRDLGYLRTRTGCYISVAEVNEQYISFPRVLNQCKINSWSKHWIGALRPQYSQKYCYACPSLACSSEDLGSTPFVDLDCWTIGEAVRNSPLWIRNKEERCYFPGLIFDERSWAGGYSALIIQIYF